MAFLADLVMYIAQHPFFIDHLVADENRRTPEWERIKARLQVDGLELQNLTPEQQNDQELVYVAVLQNGLALQFASPTLKNDLSVVRPAIAQNPDAAQYATAQVRTQLAAENARMQLAMYGPILDRMEE